MLTPQCIITSFTRTGARSVSRRTPFSRTPPAVPRHSPLLPCRQVDGHAVGDGGREQGARLGRGVAVHAVQHQPAVEPPRVPADLRTVDLVAQDEGREAGREGRPERPPAPHHLPDALVAPEAQAHRTGGDPGDDAVLLGPFAKLEPGDGAIPRVDLA